MIKTEIKDISHNKKQNKSNDKKLKKRPLIKTWNNNR